ncbi:PH domain-containing protein [Halegenticoccus tardaugens]|uniref:PH domain-containing protein n=1 Tax=Halegenticoccus tardaugens TaxID=2071624 RepID=UPI0013E8FCE5|nr:PH domain-containing protein [Halegenticoccus tardaugens]
MSADKAEPWLWLRTGEEVRWRGRPRVARILPSVVFGLAIVATATGLAILVDPVAVALAAFGVVPPAAAFLRVTNTEFVVTSRGLWVKTGVLGRTVRRVNGDRIQNTAYRQSVRGSLFGYGTVVAEVAGGSDVRFFDVRDPQSVEELIANCAPHDGGIPGRIDQWRAILATIRDVRAAVETPALRGDCREDGDGRSE